MLYEKKNHRLSDGSYGSYDQKKVYLTPEEQEMRKENLKHRGNIDRAGLKRLQAAICLQAVADYKYAEKSAKHGLMCFMNGKGAGVKPEVIMKECFEYFDTDLFKATTGYYDPMKTVKAIRNVPDGYSDTLLKKKK